jgi:Ca2+-binding RTX toxin-like protein
MPVINGTSSGETLNGSSGADSIFGLGGNDTLNGLESADLLDGGSGQDTMAGGTGDDRYVVDDILDTIVELTGQGDDMVHSSVSYTLAAGVSVETMTTMYEAGTAAIDFTGNELGQSIYANDGANWLNGGGGSDYLVGLGGNDFLNGGTGMDYLRGGAGDDLYLVDSLGDVVFENGGEGDDRVASSSNYILAAGVEVETMGTANADSMATLHLTGNEFGQSIYGSAGVNWLSGGGGADYLVGLGGDDILWGGGGDDNLAGGAGSDIFTFLYGEGVDTILDFVSGVDKINLGNLYLDAGQLAFIGSDPFSGVQRQGRFANGVFELDVNGDKIVDFAVNVHGTLAATDFVFREDIGWGNGAWDVIPS